MTWKYNIWIKHILWIITFCTNLGPLCGFNIFEDNVDIFRGDSGSLFGYSVLQHENSQGKWILVGAPRSSSVYQRTLESPGALYRCDISTNSTTNQRCHQIAIDMNGNQKYVSDGAHVFDAKDNQWLGVSLDRYQGAPGQPGQVAVCGHRWVNYYDAFYRRYYEYPHGMCYTINSELQIATVQKLQPCVTGQKVSKTGIPWHGWCQAGSSVHYTNNGTLLLGAPGTIGWRGTVISMAGPEARLVPWSAWYPTGEAEEGYVGYSLSSGSFTTPTAKEGVTGAPRAYEVGKVFIFDVNTFQVKHVFSGEQMNTYFGSAVLAVDLNSDGFSDLVVGAPLYTEKMDEGIAYVYINNGQGNLHMLADKLRGNNEIGGRFGTAVANVGDLNQDGYPDIAVGAPFEGDGSGAVYIYHGSLHGIKTHYVQRIGGSSAIAGITSFGSAITGGMDLDGNGYPDIVIGAHQNDTAVYYRSQPVITVAKSLHLIPEVLSPNSTLCFVGGRPVTCVRIELCLRYTGHELPAERGFDYTISADMMRTDQGLPSRFFFTQNIVGTDTSTINNNIVLHKDKERCMEHAAYLKHDVRDFLNFVQFKSTYSLRERVNIPTGLPYLLDPAYPHTITKEAAFVRDCGNNAICETDIQVESFLETSSKKRVLYLEGDPGINVDILVTNSGEEAHQAAITIWYPSDVAYIGFQPIIGGLLPCDFYEVGEINCRLGNPMTSNSKVHFKLRFDVSDLSSDRDSVNFTVSVETSSVELNSTLHNNIVEPSIPIRVLADILIRGTSTPEQIIYGEEDSEKDPIIDFEDTQYLYDVVRQIEIKKGIGELNDPVSAAQEQTNIVITQNNTVIDEGLTEDESQTDVDESVIGSSIVFTFEVRNLGPSFIPMPSHVNISVPWRLKNGDWLLYLTGSKSFDGIRECNTQDILVEQSSTIKEHYNWGNQEVGVTEIDKEKDKNNLPPPHESGVYLMDCNSVSCVTITCQIDPLHEVDSVVIKIYSLLWKHSFEKHEIGVAGLKTEAFVKVIDPMGRFTQPRSHRPDETQVVTTVAAEQIELPTQPIPLWIIIAAVVGGLLLLVILVIVMAKLGFFDRMSKEEMEKLLDENQKANTDANGFE